MNTYGIRLVVFLFFVLGACTFARAAEIIHLEGSVQVQDANSDEWRAASVGMTLKEGDRVRTARRSSVDIVLDGARKNTVRIEQKALVTLNSSVAGEMDRIDLSRGKVYANLEGLKAEQGFEVTTPSAVAGVRGSSYSVYAERDADEVQALKDSVFIKAYDVDKNVVGELVLPEGFKTFIERFEGPGNLIQMTLRDVDRGDTVVDDLSSRAEGRQSMRAEREARLEQERQEQQQKKTEAEKKFEDLQKSGQGAEQQVADQLQELKDQVDDSTADNQIEELRKDSECSEHIVVH